MDGWSSCDRVGEQLGRSPATESARDRERPPQRTSNCAETDISFVISCAVRVRQETATVKRNCHLYLEESKNYRQSTLLLQLQRSGQCGGSQCSMA